MSLSLMSDWLSGDLSSAERIWSALLPGLALAAYFILGLVAYSIRYLLKGPYRDLEIESRGSSVLVGMWIRQYFAWIMRPAWFLLVRTGIPPFSVTILSVLLALGSGVSIAAGRFALGGWLYILSGICDFFDGRLARKTGQASKAGAALDSVLDRYADAFVFMGLAWFYRDSWVLAAALTGLVGSFMVSYTRARGEGLGVQVKVGLMQRAERIVYLGIFVALSPIAEAVIVPAIDHPPHRLAVLGICLIAVTSFITAIHRLIYLLRALEGADKSLDRGSPVQRQLLKNIIASAIATGGDFAIVLALVEYLAVTPALATGLGCLAGGLVNFAVNRTWTFRSTGARLSEASRYTITSLSSAALNAGGVAILLSLPGLGYRLAWILVRTAVFLTWNFPMMRSYVFLPPENRAENNR